MTVIKIHGAKTIIVMPYCPATHNARHSIILQVHANGGAPHQIQPLFALFQQKCLEIFVALGVYLHSLHPLATPMYLGQITGKHYIVWSTSVE